MSVNVGVTKRVRKAARQVDFLIDVAYIEKGGRGESQTLEIFSPPGRAPTLISEAKILFRLSFEFRFSSFQIYIFIDIFFRHFFLLLHTRLFISQPCHKSSFPHSLFICRACRVLRAHLKTIGMLSLVRSA